jgi:hypothetical protein
MMATPSWLITGASVMLGRSRAVGRPTFQLSGDQLATAVDLLCCAAADAKASISSGMLEVPITILVRKAMRRLKRARGLTNLEIGGEHELLNVEAMDASVVGRIDIVLRFLHQFGDEEAYLGVECKRVAPGNSTLNGRYVTEGVARFVTGKYGAGHHVGIMLGYVLRLPLADLIEVIDATVRATYGNDAGLASVVVHKEAVSMASHELTQPAGHHIVVVHVFVDMTAAA